MLHPATEKYRTKRLSNWEIAFYLVLAISAIAWSGYGADQFIGY